MTDETNITTQEEPQTPKLEAEAEEPEVSIPEEEPLPLGWGRDQLGLIPLSTFRSGTFVETR